MSPLDLAFAPGVAGLLLGGWWRAYANLSERGIRNSERPFFATFAGPEMFTETGWRYRNRALKVTVTGALISILLAGLV